MGQIKLMLFSTTHGSVWRKQPDRIIRLYDRWSRHESEEGIAVAYGSMYGNTEKMMEAVVRGIAEVSFRTVRVHNVSQSRNSFILRDAWWYKGLILGSPTYDAKLFPPMDSLVRLLSAKMIRNRCVGVFGNCGWSGGGVKALTEFVKKANLQLVEPVVEARFTGNQEQLEQCVELGTMLASAVREQVAAPPRASGKS